MTRPVAGYCSGPNSTNATCGRYTAYYRTLCDEPPFPKFLGPGDMYSRFTKLRVVSYDDGDSFDLESDVIVMQTQDDFYPKITKVSRGHWWRPHVAFRYCRGLKASPAACRQHNRATGRHAGHAVLDEQCVQLVLSVGYDWAGTGRGRGRVWGKSGLGDAVAAAREQAAVVACRAKTAGVLVFITTRILYNVMCFHGVERFAVHAII
eukprot:SAG22_NODE_89_length_21278_cov_16.698758_4_plen_207_part_00